MVSNNDLLFGILAVKLDLISLDQFSQAHAAWSAHQELPMAETLVR